MTMMNKGKLLLTSYVRAIYGATVNIKYEGVSRERWMLSESRYGHDYQMQA